MKTHFLFIAILLTAYRSFGQDTTQTYTINFPANKTGLNNSIKTTLDSVARTIKMRAINCVIMSCNYGENEKRSIAGWNRMNNMVTYLVEKQQVQNDRIIYTYNSTCTSEAFEISFTSVNERSNKPAPHPNLRRKADK